VRPETFGQVTAGSGDPRRTRGGVWRPAPNARRGLETRAERADPETAETRPEGTRTGLSMPPTSSTFSSRHALAGLQADRHEIGTIAGAVEHDSGEAPIQYRMCGLFRSHPSENPARVRFPTL
jgi:hypothetical protein